MENRAFSTGERLWLCGREVTFVRYHDAGHPRPAGPRIGAAVIVRDGELETRDVPLWILARDRAESVSRANSLPTRLGGWD